MDRIDLRGHGIPSSTGDGGLATDASLSSPLGLAWHGTDLFVADSSGREVRRISDDNHIYAYAGNGDASSSGDGGAATSAGIGLPIAPWSMPG